MQKPFGHLRDPLFLACLAIYVANRIAEDLGLTHWLLRGYLNDFICIGFWVPILTFGLARLGLRESDPIPEGPEIAIAFLVWALMFEVWLPTTSLLADFTTADPWDVVCYAAGGILAGIWWRWHYEAASLGQREGSRAGISEF